MNTARAILVMAGCFLLQGIAQASALVAQQSVGNSTMAASGHSNDADRTTPPNDRKAQTPSDEGDGLRLPDRIYSHNAGLTRPKRLKVAQNRGEHSRSRTFINVRQPSSIKPTRPAGTIAANRSQPIRPAAGFGISGEQVENGHNRGTIPAVIGGPAKTIKSNAALNGTAMNRRHLD